MSIKSNISYDKFTKKVANDSKIRELKKEYQELQKKYESSWELMKKMGKILEDLESRIYSEEDIKLFEKLNNENIELHKRNGNYYKEIIQIEEEIEDRYNYLKSEYNIVMPKTIVMIDRTMGRGKNKKRKSTKREKPRKKKPTKRKKQ